MMRGKHFLMCSLARVGLSSCQNSFKKMQSGTSLSEFASGCTAHKHKNPTGKAKHHFLSGFFIVPEAGLEPARGLPPLDFESSASADSATPA